MRLAAVVAERTPYNARLQASVALRGDAAMDAAAARFRWPAGVESCVRNGESVVSRCGKIRSGESISR